MKKKQLRFLHGITGQLLLSAFLCMPMHGFSQLKKIDSLKSILATFPSDTQTARIYTRLGFLYTHLDADSSTFYSKKALEMAELTKDKKIIAEAQIQLATQDVNMSSYEDGIGLAMKAYPVFERMKDYGQCAYATNIIGNAYIGSGYKNEALQWYRISLSYANRMNNEFKIAVALFGIGNTEYDLGLNDSAFVHFQRCEQLFIKLGKTREAVAAMMTRAEIVSNKGMYYESLQLLLNNEQKIRDLNDNYLLGNFYQQSAVCLRELKKYKQALEADYHALSIYAEVKTLSNIKEVYNDLAKTHAANGNTDSAYYYSKLYIRLNDSLFSTENVNRIALLQAKFQSVGKDKEILQKDLANKQTQADLQAKADQQKILILGLALMIIVAFFVWRSYRRKRKDNLIIAAEKKKSDELLLNILPQEIADELKEFGSAKARNFEIVTVMFTDFKGFTSIAEKLSAEELVTEINECFVAFDNVIQKYGIEKIKTIGDAYLAAGGLPTPKATHAIDVMMAAKEILAFMEDLKRKKGDLGFEIRIGIHSGPVVAGIVGIKKFAYDIWGDTVNTASRMETNSEAGKINISASTYELVKHQFNCISRGKIDAKGKGEIEMYFVQ